MFSKSSRLGQACSTQSRSYINPKSCPVISTKRPSDSHQLNNSAVDPIPLGEILDDTCENSRKGISTLFRDHFITEPIAGREIAVAVEYTPHAPGEQFFCRNIVGVLLCRPCPWESCSLEDPADLQLPDTQPRQDVRREPEQPRLPQEPAARRNRRCDYCEGRSHCASFSIPKPNAPGCPTVQYLYLSKG
jgi:hypothetical protein